MNDRDQAAQVLQQIYAEDPTKWPNGLTMGHFDGGCWLVKQASTPVGFVGWQERFTVEDRPKRIGYYSIGILPEHRGRKYAKVAISRVIHAKQANVDEVRALIVDHNVESQKLAESLGIQQQIVKTAGASSLSDIVVNPDGSLGRVVPGQGIL